MTDFAQRVGAAKRELRARSVDGVQRRAVPFDCEVRAKDDGGYELVGHGAVFNELSENLGGFREQIDPGAFAKVLEGKPDVRALFNHDPNLVLARTTNGTLSLAEDDAGLAYRADVAPTTYGNDLRILLDRGDVDQSSFAFRVADDSWDEDEDGRLVRTIREFSALYDVSPVTYPAYPQTDAGAANVTVTITSNTTSETPSPDEERESEQVADKAGSTAEPGEADGANEDVGLSRTRLRHRLRLREHKLRA